MAKIANYPVLDFSGGIRKDKGAGTLNRNEVLDVRNVHLNETGRVNSRRGSHEVGQTLSTTVENIFPFVRYSLTGTAVAWTMINTNGTTAVVSTLTSNRLTSSITTASTTINVVSTTNTPVDFTNSGTIEIDGDLIAYSGSTGTSFTGCTGIRTSHTAGVAVNQWTTLTQSGTAVDGRLGVYYAVLNNILFFAGRTVNMKQFDGNSVSDVSAEPAILFLTNYRDRLYGAGDGSNALNGISRRISFSNRGDGTTWTTAADFFDVEDQGGEAITALWVHSDRLGIFKTNSIYTYDEISLKQRAHNVGAYNQKVVQELNGLLYTFCPEGIFETNLFSTKQIGEPVRRVWEQFKPIYDSVSKRVCTNTFAWTYQDSYYVFLGAYSLYSSDSIVLEYNTKQNNWTIHDGIANQSGFPASMRFISNIKNFRYGDNPLNVSSGLFGADGQIMYRFYEDKYIDNQSTPVLEGNDIFVDLVNDNAGVPIPVRIETQLYDLTHPELFKKFKRLRVLTESGQWNLEYRVEDERGEGPYRLLGSVSTTNKVLDFPKDAQGWSCGLRISGVNTNGRQTFNGFIFEDTEAIPRP